MLSDLENSPVKSWKGKTKRIAVSSSSSDDDSDIPVRKRKTPRRMSNSDSSDSDGSCIIQRRKKLKALPDSDCSSTSSDSTDFEGCGHWYIQRRKKKNRPLQSDSESDAGYSKGSKEKSVTVKKEPGASSSSDDEGEKCIICFKAFRDAVAHPSGCHHNFHSECLLTWSKTSNTCPIDRVKYTEVIVAHPQGGIISRHEVKTPPPQDHNNDIEPDDPTFCEVCSQHDREHEMLLCDRCEAGYHINCLDPPLTDIPVGDWFCPDCARWEHPEVDDDELNYLLRDGEIIGERLRQRARPLSRITPRTRAARRVMDAIRLMAEQSEIFGPSTSTSHSTVQNTSRRRKKKPRRRTTRSTHYKVEVVTVEDGSTIELKVAVNSRKRRKKRKTNCGHKKSNSSKRHSCPSTSNDLHHSGSNHDRLPSQTLDIMGSRPQLEYFSGCEAEDELDEDGGLSVLRARTVSSRSMANRKQIAAQILRTTTPRRPTPVIAVSSAPPDLLSSILDEQTKWHSPNTVIQSNSNGEVKVIMKDKTSNVPTRKSVAAGEGGSSSSGGGEVKSSSPKDAGGSAGGGRGDQRNGEAASSLVPPLEPPPQPVFSRVYEDEDFDLYADIEPPYVKSKKSFNHKK